MLLCYYLFVYVRYRQPVVSDWKCCLQTGQIAHYVDCNLKHLSMVGLALDLVDQPSSYRAVTLFVESSDR